MTQTSNTEFYSLSLNSLAPPPYSSPEPQIAQLSDIESGDEKQEKPVVKGLVRRLTPPFLRETFGFTQHEAAQSSRQRSWFADLVVNGWLWESFSLCTSVLCTFGIALLLGYWNERAVPDRWPSGITLNAYIAVLSGVTKYALAVPVEAAISQSKWHWFAKEPRPLIDFERFDDASRGPWGSMNLLLRIKARTVASIGAIVTVLSLAMDPFFQQVIDLPKRPSALGQSAVPRMKNFELQRNTYVNSTDGLDVIAPDRLMEDVVFSYMVNGGTSRNISAFCPSQDCAWKPFDTLAMCSSCTDVSDLLTLACLEESGDWRTNASTGAEASKSFSCGYFANATSSNPVLMSGYALNTSSVPAQPLDYLLMRTFNLQDVNVDRTYWNGSIHYQTPSFPIVDFIQVASQSIESIMNGNRPVARECAIRWCTKRIVASYDAGEYREQTISEAFDEEPPFDALQFGDDMFFSYNKNITISPAESNETFTVPNSTILATIFLFQDFFPSYLVAVNESATPLLQTRNFNADTPRHWQYPENPFAALEPGNDYVNNMTRTLTNVMRSYPDTSEFFRGSGGTESYVKARWGYMALPVFLVLLTSILLITVIINQRKSKGVGRWKSSALATLTNGLHDQDRALFVATSQLSDVFECSSQLKVKLCKEPSLDRFTLRVHDRMNT